MSTTNQVMTQAEIDSLLSVRNESKGGPATNGGAVRPSVSRAQTPDGAGRPTATPDSPRGPAASLAARPDALESITKKVEQLESAVSETRVAIRQIQQVLQALAGSIEGVRGKVEATSDDLQATPGYAIKKTFSCQSCHGHGFVAARMTCTQCGTESLWGWWPSREQNTGR